MPREKLLTGEEEEFAKLPPALPVGAERSRAVIYHAVPSPVTDAFDCVRGSRLPSINAEDFIRSVID